jgi:hypothetical protein
MNFINWIADNWYLFIGGLIILAALISFIIAFIKLPLPEKFKKIRQWLLYAVIEAEKQLGSETGQLKLRLVYNWFIDKFKFVAIFLSFEKFSQLVDDALDEMRKLLEENEKLAEFVISTK